MEEEKKSRISQIASLYWKPSDQPFLIPTIYLLIVLAFFSGFNLLLGCVLFLFATLYKKENRKSLFQNRFHPILILLSSFFLLQLIGILYSSDIEQGFIKSEIKLPFLLLPISFFAIPKRLLNQLYKVTSRFFVSVSFFATIVCYLIATYKSVSNQSFFLFNEETGEKGISFFTYTELSQSLMHPGYLTLFISSAILMLIWKHIEKKSNVLDKLLIVHFLIFVFLLQGRGSLLALLFVLFAGFVIYIIKNRKYIQLSILVLPAVLFVSFIRFAPEKVTERFTKPLNLDYDITKPNKSDFNGVTIRFAEWTGAIHTIKKFPLIGTGTGDWKKELMKSYKEVGFVVGIEHQFNCHNQFLETQLSNGLPGSIILVLILVIISLHSIRRKNYLLLGLIWMFYLGMLTESTLDRQWGIFLLVFFSSWMVRISVDDQEAIEETKE